MADTGVGSNREQRGEETNFEIVVAPAPFKSDVWTYFTFPRNDKRQKVMDEPKTIGRRCQTLLTYILKSRKSAGSDYIFLII